MAGKRWLSQEVKRREQPAVAVGRMSRGSHLGVAVAFWWRRRSAVAGAAVSLAAVAGGAVGVATVAVGAVAAVAVSAGFVGLF